MEGNVSPFVNAYLRHARSNTKRSERKTTWAKKKEKESIKWRETSRQRLLRRKKKIIVDTADLNISQNMYTYVK